MKNLLFVAAALLGACATQPPKPAATPVEMTRKDIAALYHTSSNNVGAWISRAAKKLRSDPDFLDTFDIAC